MKNSKVKLFAFSALLIMGFACSQKTDDLQAKKIETDKSLMVEADSAAIAEAKKKAAAEEKAKPPKPYNEKENAEAKIAELVKKAKKENNYREL